METIVRCKDRHLFITPWILTWPLQGVRLGPSTRFQRCPVCEHWTIVHSVSDGELTEEERRAAASASA